MSLTSKVFHLETYRYYSKVSERVKYFYIILHQNVTFSPKTSSHFTIRVVVV